MGFKFAGEKKNFQNLALANFLNLTLKSNKNDLQIYIL